MAFGSKMNDRSWLGLAQQREYGFALADVDALEAIAAVTLDRCQVLEIAGIGEPVEIEHWLDSGCQPVQNEIRADEASAASDQDHSIIR